MTLERLVEEIRARAESEIAAVQKAAEAEAQAIEAERARRLDALRRELRQATDQEIARERTQRISAARLEARQRLDAAREARLERGIAETRRLLAEFTASPRYAATLARMVEEARRVLGPEFKVEGRREDASLLREAAGAAFDPTPRPILGGLIARTVDGRRELNLSLDELLRLREDRVRARLA